MLILRCLAAGLRPHLRAALTEQRLHLADLRLSVLANWRPRRVPDQAAQPPPAAPLELLTAEQATLGTLPAFIPVWASASPPPDDAPVILGDLRSTLRNYLLGKRRAEVSADRRPRRTQRQLLRVPGAWAWIDELSRATRPGGAAEPSVLRAVLSLVTNTAMFAPRAYPSQGPELSSSFYTLPAELHAQCRFCRHNLGLVRRASRFHVLFECTDPTCTRARATAANLASLHAAPMLRTQVSHSSLARFLLSLFTLPPSLAAPDSDVRRTRLAALIGIFPDAQLPGLPSPLPKAARLTISHAAALAATLFISLWSANHSRPRRSAQLSLPAMWRNSPRHPHSRGPGAGALTSGRL